MDKKQIYSQKQIVEKYDHWRFGGRSGKFVNLKELSIIEELLKGVRGRILDIPCGTGRLAKYLLIKNPNIDIVGADYSLEMLNLAKDAGYKNVVRADAFNLSFKQGFFDCIVSLRFIFHYKNIYPLFQEAAKVLKKDGVLIFDTYKWSPYQILGVFFKKYKDKVFIHSREDIKSILEKSNFKLITIKHCFLFSPLIYRFLPISLIAVLDKLEKIFPQQLLVKSFYKVKKM
ncbi:MAG: class I SAM-dependent methyltransferase [Patescibacteria group bacterium]